MVGNKQGALKARDTLLKKDPDHFKKLGRKGGKNSPGQFDKDPILARTAGSRGGLARRAKLEAKKNTKNKPI